MVRLKPDTTEVPAGVRQRPGAPVKQTIEVGVTASGDKTREPATSARTRLGPSANGSEQQMPATCFATPTFLFAAPVLPDDDARGRALCGLGIQRQLDHFREVQRLAAGPLIDLLAAA